jgi:hypothetical protein
MESSTESLSNLPVNDIPRKPIVTSESHVDLDSKSTNSTPKTVAEYDELTPITIPIFDMMIELFDLHHGNNWPRKALVDAVQRLLGGRIERLLPPSILLIVES